MQQDKHAHSAGCGTPASETDFHGTSAAAHAALTVEGEDYARAWLERLHADTAQPGERAVLMTFLTGEMQRGACRVIEKALGVRRHA